jgi:hypothetical protein
MGRNRVIYQSKAVYAGPDKSSANAWIHETGNNQPFQLKRVQSANYGFDVARTDVNQFGELAAIDRIILDSPTVNFDSSWYMCNMYNEDKIGLYVNAKDTAEANLSGILANVLEDYAGERNYYVRVVKDGSDVNGITTGDNTAGNNSVIGIGNGFLSNWSCEGAVGGFPTANITVEGLNIKFDKGKTSGFSPHVDASDGTANSTKKYHLSGYQSHAESTVDMSVVKPGDITLTLPDSEGGADESSMSVQSFNCSVDLAREPLQKLGSRFAFARELTFPLTATMSVDALTSEIATGNLATIINTNSDQKIIVALKSGDSDHMAVVMKKGKLDSQSFSQGIGDNETVTLNWSAQIGSRTQTDVGVFLSGDHA